MYHSPREAGHRDGVSAATLAPHASAGESLPAIEPDGSIGRGCFTSFGGSG